MAPSQNATPRGRCGGVLALDRWLAGPCKFSQGAHTPRHAGRQPPPATEHEASSSSQHAAQAPDKNAPPRKTGADAPTNRRTDRSGGGGWAGSMRPPLTLAVLRSRSLVLKTASAGNREQRLRATATQGRRRGRVRGRKYELEGRAELVTGQNELHRAGSGRPVD